MQWRSDLASAHRSAPSKYRLQTCIALASSISDISLGRCGSGHRQRVFWRSDAARGALTERLSLVYPKARITGIDITPKVGRLYCGDRERVTFNQQTIHDLVAGNPASFDLILISDVIHHVPWELHEQLLTDAAKGLEPGGRFVLKDWEKADQSHPSSVLSQREVYHRGPDPIQVRGRVSDTLAVDLRLGNYRARTPNSPMAK